MTTESLDELTVGVIGGMGPEATADFLSKLVAATPVEREQEHLRVVVDSNPKVPDRNAGIAGFGLSPAPALAAMARGLERAGAGFVVMTCNTAHAFASDIRAALTVPFVSMIDETLAEVVRLSPSGGRVGLLAAQGCLDAGLYQSALAAHDRRALVPAADDQARFMALLYRIKRGDRGDGVRADMRALAAGLVAEGADVLIAACTEVPLVLLPADCARPLIDPAAVLAARCVRYARRLEALPVVQRPRTSPETYFA